MKAVLDEARDIIFEAIMVRRGEVITPELAIERARNAAQALMVLLDRPVFRSAANSWPDGEWCGDCKRLRADHDWRGFCVAPQPDNRPETTTPVDWNDPRIR